MEGEAGAQVAPPILIHPGARFHEVPPLAKKRDSPWQSPGLRHGAHQQKQNQPWLAGSLPPSPRGNWNPKMWSWDSVAFSAKPVEPANGEENSKGPASSKAVEEAGEDGREAVNLNLGGGAYFSEQPAVRPNKRVRSGSPGTSGSSYPMCQVDDCMADLSGAKDYHRRHKVCEIHSKMTKALVGKQMQRFCQQCSRFHPLSEFDEGKRSCRRRLAGHNRRRRKTQLEDASSRLLPPGNKGNNSSNENLDIVNLLAVLSRFQGNGADKLTGAPALPDRDHLIQILSKLNSLPTANSKVEAPVCFDLNASQTFQQDSPEQSARVNGNPSALLTRDPSTPLTRDLLAVLSAGLTSSSPDALIAVSQGSSDCSGEDRPNIGCAEASIDVSSHNQSAQIIPSIGAARNDCTLSTQFEIRKHPVQETQLSLPFQLFSSAEDDSPPNLCSSRKYVSSESSNPMDDRSPSSSPPVTRKFFPLHSAKESMKQDRTSTCREENADVEAGIGNWLSAPLDLVQESDRQVTNDALRNLPYQAGDTSSSGSDHSPCSSNSDPQDRTWRILFKLFDKDPGSLPETLRTQILNWLSHSPSEIESYIRPGCVVLSVYVSMPAIAWDELERNLLQRVSSLVQCCESDFWRSGSFLVQTNRQLVLHKDGKVRLCKSWRTWNAPELISVLPIAVVGGKATSLLLRGRNLTARGTKIHCTYMGGYASKEVLGSAYPGTVYDDSCLESFTFPGGYPNLFGRCFVEVENGFIGNSFPVIIADASICQELRALELDFEVDRETMNGISEGQVSLRSRDDVLHFLNELGWLFQRKNAPYPVSMDFSCTRFRFLFTFSVERDWVALVRTLLDMLVEQSSEGDGLSHESLGLLLEIQLLSRAVKRECRKMVDLLLHYSVKGAADDLKTYLFPPNSAGPGGVTPLHLAASILDSEDIVDSLTNDPQEIGLKCWSSVKDDGGRSPYMYASMRNNHCYNSLIARKLLDKKNGHVSILVGNQETSLDKAGIARVPQGPRAQLLQARTCARCAVMETGRFRPTVRGQGLLQRPYVLSMLTIAAVCVCVCIFFRGSPKIGSHAFFMWEYLEYGTR